MAGSNLVAGQSIANGSASITGSEVTLRAANSERLSIIIANEGPGTLYVGTSGVTSANTIPVKSGGNVTLTWSAAAEIRVINSGGNCDVRFLEETE